jgi:hypothetical protein
MADKGSTTSRASSDISMHTVVAGPGKGGSQVSIRGQKSGGIFGHAAEF